jgi:6-phospho-beta-glucosidase
VQKEKVVFIGGGSCFTPAQVQVMLDTKELFEGVEVCLYDINAKYLPLISKTIEQLIKRKKANIKLTSTTDVKEALKNATFIFFMWNVGGAEALKNDVNIPTSHGISGDETAGIGGTFMAQRNIPVAIEYCKLIEEICPDAWIISHSNPINLLADAIRRETNVRFIPICDGFIRYSMSLLPRWLDMPPYDRRYCTDKDLRPRAIGINHFTWLVDLQVNGKDGYPLLRQKFNEAKDKFKGEEQYIKADLPINLFETYGYQCITPMHAMLYYEQKEWLERTKHFEKLFYSDGLGWSEDREKLMQKIADGGEYVEHPTGVRAKDFCFILLSARQTVGIMVDILTNEGREWGGVNFVNNGTITNLPDSTIVEGPVIINAKGVNPIPMGKLPKPFVGLSYHLITWAELSVDAALSGDKSILYQAILACPYVHDMTDAKTIMEEMLIANAKFLPQYKI